MSNQRTIYMYEIADVVNEMIDVWTNETLVKLDEAQNETINGARNYAKRETTKLKYGNKKPYINCYSNRKAGDHARALWNRKYSLSHLLEDGHKVYNQSGGPYPIKNDNRVMDTTSNRNAKVTSSMETTQYDMFDETFEDYVKDKYIKKIIQKLGG